MKKLYIPLLICICLVLSVFAQSSKLKRQIESQNAKFNKRIAKKDFKSASEIYTANGQLLQPNGKTIMGRENIAKFWQSTFETGIKEIKLITREVGGKGKIIYETGKFEVFLPNNQLVDDGKFIVIWKKVKGKWLRYQDIWNSNRKIE